MVRFFSGAITAVVLIVASVVASAAPAGAAPRVASPLKWFVRTCQHVGGAQGGGAGSEMAWCYLVPDRSVARLQRSCSVHGGVFEAVPFAPDGEADGFTTYYCYAS